MLKIKDNVDLKELEKYKIYPHYVCNEQTGKVYIDGLRQDLRFGFLGFKKKRKRITHIIDFKEDKFEFVLNDEKDIELDLLYDLIKDGLVEKVEE
jgi:hypothetical protein